MTNWDYALMTHEASLLGGPELYIASIREAGYLDGIGKGAAIGVATTAAISGLAFLAYTKVKEKRALAAAAETTLLNRLASENAMEKNDHCDTPEDGDIPDTGNGHN